MKIVLQNNSFCITAPKELFLDVKKIALIINIKEFLSKSYYIPVSSISIYNSLGEFSDDSSILLLVAQGQGSFNINFPEETFNELINMIKANQIRAYLEIMENEYKNGWRLDLLTDKDGYALVHYASIYGCCSVLTNIHLNNPERINLITNDGWTPLQLACRYNHRKCVNSLISYKSLNINQVTLNGTALHVAVEAKNIGSVKILLENDADIKIENFQGKTCIEMPTTDEILQIIPQITGQKILVRSFNLNNWESIWIVTRIKSKFSRNYQCRLSVNIETGRFKECSIDSEDDVCPTYKKKLIKLQLAQSFFNPRSTNNFYFKLYFPDIILKYSVNTQIARDEIVERIKRNSEYCRWKEIGIRPKPEENNFNIKQSFREEDNDWTQRKINLKEFEKIKQIGSGTFGDVYLIRNKYTGEYFALKSCSQNKSFLKESNTLLKHAIIEYEILNNINHPFVVKFYWAISTKNHLNFILEYCTNGDLNNLLEKIGPMSDNQARFVLSCIFLGLSIFMGKI